MTTNQKAELIVKVIEKLNEHVKKENKELCAKNLYREQKPLHGGETWIKLAFMEDKDFIKVVKACGL